MLAAALNSTLVLGVAPVLCASAVPGYHLTPDTWNQSLDAQARDLATYYKRSSDGPLREGLHSLVYAHILIDRNEKRALAAPALVEAAASLRESSATNLGDGRNSDIFVVVSALLFITKILDRNEWLWTPTEDLLQASANIALQLESPTSSLQGVERFAVDCALSRVQMTLLQHIDRSSLDEAGRRASAHALRRVGLARGSQEWDQRDYALPKTVAALAVFYPGIGADLIGGAPLNCFPSDYFYGAYRISGLAEFGLERTFALYLEESAERAREALQEVGDADDARQASAMITAFGDILARADGDRRLMNETIANLLAVPSIKAPPVPGGQASLAVSLRDFLSMARGMERRIRAIAETIRDAGGRALVVGGCVRDRLLGRESKDFDMEVYGLSLEELEGVLGRFGEVIRVGRSFGVLRVKGLDVDFSIPRRDSKMGPGHRGFEVELDPGLSFEEASRRRDLTINSMGWDPLSDEVFDPHGGREDLERRILRATDPLKFSEDPLRGLRVAQFAARFDMNPDPELLALCARLDLEELPGERLWGEFRKMLLKSRRPSRGLEFLRQTGLLRFFPELAVLVDTPQDPEFHPEGTVWQHTLLVVDEAAQAKTGDDAQDLIILFGALCHDMGKATTTIFEDGHIRSPEHSEKGEAPTEAFLRRLRAPKNFITQIKALVRNHLAPMFLVTNGATAKGYRRLAHRLEEAGVNSQLLYLMARADHFGVTSEDSLARRYPYGDEFLRVMSDLNVDRVAERDVVMGRHLIAHGLTPGPQFTPILERCREIQYETGWDDPERILEHALGTDDGSPLEPIPPQPNLLSDTPQTDISPKMINLPANPTANDINAIGLLLPGGFQISFDQGRVVMTVLGGNDYGIPLFTYEITPNTKQDYEGPLLSLLLEDLARRVAQALRNTPFDSPETFNDIQNVILPPVQDVISRHCPNNEFSIRIGEILTTEASDWGTLFVSEES